MHIASKSTQQLEIVNEPAALLAYVERVKASWRETERNKTWEEKIAAIERMREREQQLKRARELVATSSR